MRCRCKSENQQLCMRIAKAGNGFAPIFPFAKGEAFLARYLFAVFHETRTFTAEDDFNVQVIESRHRFPQETLSRNRSAALYIQSLPGKLDAANGVF